MEAQEIKSTMSHFLHTQREILLGLRKSKRIEPIGQKGKNVNLK
jgi:hypothetical protein